MGANMPACTDDVNPDVGRPRVGPLILDADTHRSRADVPRYIIARMRLRPVFSIASVSLAAMLAACGSSSTGPAPATFSDALHLDSLAVAAAVAGNLDLNNLLTYPIAVLGEGIPAANGSLSVNGAAQPYQVAVLEVVGTTGGQTPVPSDSFFVISSWTKPDASTLLFVQVDAPNTIIQLEGIEGTRIVDTLAAAPSASVGAFKQTGGCHTLKTSTTAAYLLQGTTCTAGNIPAAFSVSFANGAHSYILAQATVPAARIVLPAGSGGQQRVRALLHALRVGHT